MFLVLSFFILFLKEGQARPPGATHFKICIPANIHLTLRVLIVLAAVTCNAVLFSYVFEAGCLRLPLSTGTVGSVGILPTVSPGISPLIQRCHAAFRRGNRIWEKN